MLASLHLCVGRKQAQLAAGRGMRARVGPRRAARQMSSCIPLHASIEQVGLTADSPELLHQLEEADHVALCQRLRKELPPLRAGELYSWGTWQFALVERFLVPNNTTLLLQEGWRRCRSRCFCLCCDDLLAFMCTDPWRVALLLNCCFGRFNHSLQACCGEGEWCFTWGVRCCLSS